MPDAPAPTRPARPPSLPPASAPRRGGRESWRKTTFRLHGWIGLNLGLLLFVVCFSGTVATLSHEIDWLVDARHRTAPQTGPVDWTAMHETVARVFPDGVNLGVYAPGASGTAAAGSRAAAVAYVDLPNGQTRRAYLDPTTGELRGHTSFFNSARFFRSFHRRFFDGNRGIVIVTLWGFVLLASALSGFAFYKGWLKQAVTLRLSGGRRLRWSDLHRTGGVWALAFAALIGATGVFYFVEVMAQGAGNYDALLPPELPAVEEAGLAAFGPQPELLPAGEYVRAAEAAYPGFEVRSVRMPNVPGDPVYVDGQAGNVLTRDRADKVHLHPFTAEVLGVQRTADLGAVPLVTDAVDPLHFGYFGGLWTKGLWFAFGLVLSFSVLSGTYLWVVRSATGRGGSRWLRGAPVAVAVTLAYFVVVAFATVRGIQDYAPSEPPSEPVARLDVGPYDVRVDCAAPCDVGAGATVTTRFLGDGLPNYAAAEVVAPGVEPDTLAGPSWRPSAEVAAAPSGPLALRVTGRDGAVYASPFGLRPVEGAAPTPTWPDTAPGVWAVAWGFLAITAACVVGWLALVARVARRRSAGTRRERVPAPTDSSLPGMPGPRGS